MCRWERWWEKKRGVEDGANTSGEVTQAALPHLRWKRHGDMWRSTSVGGVDLEAHLDT